MLSYWEQDSFFKDIDVCIIGAGIVGLSTAIYLKQKSPTLNIIVVERAPLPYGASTRNAGFACFGSVSEIMEDLKNSNENEIFNLIENRWKGLQLLKQNIGENNLEFEQNGGFELFKNEDDELFEACLSFIPELNKKLKNIIGNETIYSVANEKVNDFGFDKIKYVIQNGFEGQINTGKMMKALVQKTQSLGITILFGLPIINLNEQENRVELCTSNFNFFAKKTLICTNGFANQLIEELDVKPARAQVLITKPIENLKIKGTFHYDKGYYYFRNVGDRILLGGGRNLAFEAETTTDILTTDFIQNKLDEMLNEIILPNKKYEVDMRWSGIMGVGNEKNPIVKWVSKNTAVALRCNGMGIALGSKTAMDAALLIGESV
jgi:glycine/D-amino acid oxidase-like deaminating enzyme